MQNLQIKKSAYIQYFLLILYKVFMDLLYIIYISKKYSYIGLKYNPSTYKYVLSFILFVLMIKPIVNYIKINSLSSMMMLLWNLIYFIPGTISYSFAGLSDIYFMFYACYWIFLTALYKFFPSIKIKRLDLASSKLFIFTTFAVLIIGSLIITGIYNGFKFHFSLSDVYDLRAEQKSKNLPVVVSYFQPIASAILPIIVVFTLINKKYLWAIIAIIIDLLYFAMGGHKGTLFSLVVALLIYLFYKKGRIKLIVLGFVALVVFSFIEIFLTKYSYITLYLIRREMFITNLLSFEYYDFFSKNELLLLRDSILRRFGAVSPYDINIPNLIGKLYWGKIETNANNGLVGDAFSNFGWFGIIVYPILITVVLRISDACTNLIDHKILLVFAAYYSLSFINGAFFSTLLTGGFIFSIFFLYVLSSINKSKSNVE